MNVSKASHSSKSTAGMYFSWILLIPSCNLWCWTHPAMHTTHYQKNLVLLVLIHCHLNVFVGLFFLWILHSSNCYLWCFSNHKRYLCPSPVSKADSPLLFSSFTHWTKLITLNHRNEEKGNPCQQLWIPEKFLACLCTRYKVMKSTTIAYKSNVINYIIYIYRWCLLLLSFRRVSGLQGCMVVLLTAKNSS